MDNLMKAQLKMESKVGENTDIIMEMSTKDSGEMTLKMETEPCIIPMEIDTKVFGKTEKKMVMENTSIIMEQYMKEILQMEKKMASGLYILLTELEFKRIGNKHIFREMEKFIIKTGTILKEVITCLKNMEKDYMCGPGKIANIKETSEKIY
jgi:hypothetical protein